MNMISPFLRKNRGHSRERIVPRDHVDLLTAVSRGRQFIIEGRIVDISPFGCHVRTQGVFEPYDRIRILLPLVGDVEAFVAWSLNGCFGARFSEAISKAAYPQILAAIKMAKAHDPRLMMPLMINQKPVVPTR